MGILQANRIEPCDFPDRIGRGEFLKKKLLKLNFYWAFLWLKKKQLRQSFSLRPKGSFDASCKPFILGSQILIKNTVLVMAKFGTPLV